MKKWPVSIGVAAIGIAAAFYLAVSGVYVKRFMPVPLPWLALSWVSTFAWLYFLIRSKVFTKPHRLLFLIGTTLALNLLVQSTGGEQSPLLFAVFLFMGIAAWEGNARNGFWIALLFGLLEILSPGREEDLGGLSPYLRWATLLVSAFFLAKVVKTRQEKERLDHRLESLKNDAVQLASNAEPSSFNVPKDRLLQEESRLSARVGSVMELEDSLTRQLALFQKSLPVHTAAFFFLTFIQERKVLRLRAFSSESNSLAPDVTVLLGETLVGLAAKEGRRVLLNQMPFESAKALPYYLKQNSVTSFLAQPVFLRGIRLENSMGEDLELVGVLVLDHKKENYFGEREVKLTEQFADMLAESIQGARILHFSKTKSRNLNALFEVSNSFSHLLDIDLVLKTALNTAVKISTCDSAFVALTEGSDSDFNVRATWEPKKISTKPAQLEEELAAWILENKKPIRYTRGQVDKGLAAFSRKESMLGSIQSFLMVPLLSDGHVLGILRLNSLKPNTYQEYDQDVLTTLANQTALALENAYMVLRIQEMAQKDGLTGVYNHRYFQEKLAEEMVKAERYNKDLSLVLLDVDHFKKFNDDYGHQEGDKVLRIVSEVIQGTVRQKVDTVARYGGEEFVVILPEADGNMGRELAERIRKNVESYLFQNNGKTLYRVTASMGIASYPFDARDQKNLIQLADRALYEAKGAGRNCVKRFKPLS